MCGSLSLEVIEVSLFKHSTASQYPSYLICHWSLSEADWENEMREGCWELNAIVNANQSRPETWLCFFVVCTRWLMVGALTRLLWDQSRDWLLNAMAWWVLPRCQWNSLSHQGLWILVRCEGQEKKSLQLFSPRAFEDQHRLLRNRSGLFLCKQWVCWELTLLFQPGCLSRKRWHRFLFLIIMVTYWL